MYQNIYRNYRKIHRKPTGKYTENLLENLPENLPAKTTRTTPYKLSSAIEPSLLFLILNLTFAAQFMLILLSQTKYANHLITTNKINKDLKFFLSPLLTVPSLIDP